MSKRKGLLPQIVVPVVVALLVGSTAPWWWSAVFERPPEGNATYWLVIHGVQLSREFPDATVRVVATVDEVEYTYPSLAGVEWLEVAPTMSSQRFLLPDAADRITVHFTMQALIRSRTRDFASQRTDVVDLDGPLPFHGEYGLHQVSGATRAGRVSATVRYSVVSDGS